jgi:hypothetical protein
MHLKSAVFFAVSLLFSQQVQGAESGSYRDAKCFLVSQMLWPEIVLHIGEKHAGRREVSTTIKGILSDFISSRRKGMALISAVDFEDDFGIFHVAAPCPRAKLLVQSILDAYRSRASGNKALPSLVLRKSPATRYEALCGVGSTKQTCPEADQGEMK